jgi:hypothetical protein
MDSEMRVGTFPGNLADDFVDSFRVPAKRADYGKNIAKDRCAECGGVIVLADGPVHRWDKWWIAGDWIHRERSGNAHAATPMRNFGS